MSWKYNLIRWWIWQRNRISKGATEMAYLKSFIVSYAVIISVLKINFDITLNWYWIILLMVAADLSQWVLGYIWDKKGIYFIESKWSNERDMLKVEMAKKFHLKK